MRSLLQNESLAHPFSGVFYVQYRLVKDFRLGVLEKNDPMGL